MADEALRAPTVFLSYASENREAARRIGAALPDYGLEVWYDESELGGGDAWDQKIRRQIRECDYFMALVSAQTEARREGYFRREWRLAVERTLDMADDHPFLLPVVIDDTDATRARVPEKFQTVQWLRVPDGAPTPGLESLCRRLASGAAAVPPPRPSLHPGGIGSGSSVPSPPSQPSQPPQDDAPVSGFRASPFPEYEQGKRVRYGVTVTGWALRNSFALYKRLPRWIRWALIIYLLYLVFGQSHSSGRHAQTPSSPAASVTQKKLDAVASRFKQDPAPDFAKLGAMVAKEFGDEAHGNGVTLLAVPFAIPAGDNAAKQLADSAFAQIYSRIAVLRHSQMSVGDAPVAGCELKPLLKLAALKDTDYVLCGMVESAASAAPVLTVTLVDVDDSSTLWHGVYSGTSTDPATIAQEVASHVPTGSHED